jgi:rubrerythrin
MTSIKITDFIPYVPEIKQVISMATSSPLLHAQWLNTLSYLENCGARKIAACEHPTKVRSEMLKHAAEEFRHAFYLKMQIGKVSDDSLVDFARESLLGGVISGNYLSKLDLHICRLLKHSYNMPSKQLKATAYLLVTYAVEKRAAILYPIYQDALADIQSKVNVRAIIAEEDRHLADIEEELDSIPSNKQLKANACAIGSRLFYDWLKVVDVLHNSLI